MDTYKSYLRNENLELLHADSNKLSESKVILQHTAGTLNASASIGNSANLGSLEYRAHSISSAEDVLVRLAGRSSANDGSGGVFDILVKQEGEPLTSRLAISDSIDLNMLATSSFKLNKAGAELRLEALGGGAGQAISLLSEGSGSSAISLSATSGGISLSAAALLQLQTTDTTNGIKIGTTTKDVPILIGHPISQTIMQNNVVIQGNLEVQGTTTYVNTEQLNVKDNIIVVNAGSLSQDGGYFVQRYQVANDLGEGDVVGDVAIESGVAQATSAATITLAGSSSAINGYYIGWWVKVPDGQVREVAAYDGTSKQATLATPWTATPLATTPYTLHNQNYAGILFNETANRLELITVPDTSIASLSQVAYEYPAVRQGATEFLGAITIKEAVFNNLTANTLLALGASKEVISRGFSVAATAGTIVERDGAGASHFSTVRIENEAIYSVLYLDSNKDAKGIALSDGQLLIGSTGNAPVAAPLTGTANQVLIASGAGSITLSLPQDIASSSFPQFSGLQLLNQGALELRELAANGSDYVRLRSPAALAASYVLTLPTTAGTPNYLLTTDGAGLLSWSAPYALPTGLSNFDANNTAGILVQTSADNYASRTLQGTADQVLVVNGDGVAGNPVLSLPQSIATTSSPIFAALTLSSPLEIASGGTGSTSFTTNALLYSDGTKLASSAALTNGQLLIGSTGAPPVAAAIAGTANQIVVSNGAGSISLSLPQDIHSGASPQFAGLQLLDQGALELRELAANGTDYVRLRSPASLTAPYTLTLPTTAGTSNYLLTTDGAGLLSWSAPYVLPTGLSNFDANNTAGILVQTAADSYASRQIVGTPDQVLITNGDGVAGNPTLSLPQSIASTSSPTFASLTLTDGASISKGVKLLDSGSKYVEILTISSLLASYQLVLPPNAGSVNQGLATDGSGVLSWQDFQAESANLNSLSAYNTTGILCYTAASTFTGRTLQGTANQITIVNGDGVAGNPVLSLPQDIASTSSPSFAALQLLDQGALELRELAANGSDYVRLRSPAALTASYVLTLPTTAGTSGYLLTTDGTGLLSWSAPYTLPTGLSNFDANNATGILVQTAADTYASRSITSSNGTITISNGDGVAGDIDVVLPQAVGTGSDVVFKSVDVASLFLRNGAFDIEMKAPTLAASYVLTLPTTAGTADYLLATDGNGVLSWTAPGAVSIGLSNFDANNTPGILVQTTADNYASRTIQGTADQVLVVDGNGVAGNPVLSLPQSIATTSSPTFAALTLSSPLAVASGGTGATSFTTNALLYYDGTKLISSAALTNGQLLIGSTGAAPVAAVIGGTANQVLVSNGAGSISLSLPQDIASTSSPSFAALQLLDQGVLELRELAANGADYVRLRSPAALSTSYVLTLPTTAGTPNYLLTTDGTGLLSWSAPYVLPTGLSNFDANNATGILVQTAADNYASRQIVGTADQVIVVNGDGVAGNPTLSLPQSIATTSSPTFAALSLSSPLAVASGGTGSASFTTNALLYSDGTKLISSAALTNGQLLIGSTGAAPVAAAIAGTANQVVVSNGAGSITLSLPQDIHSGAIPQFSGLQLLDQGYLELRESAIKGANNIRIRAPADLPGNYILELPPTAGTAGYLLTTDGTGLLSWSAPYVLPTGLSNFDANNATGILVQTAADSFASRTIQGTADQVVVVNGDGVSGNPVLSLPQSIATTSAPTFASLTLSTTLEAATAELDSLKLFNGANSIEVKAPTLAASYSLTLPTTAGTATYLLATDGTGVLSWTAPGAVSVGLTNFDANNTPGILVQTTADNYASRTLQGTTNQVLVVDGDGVAGNPVLSLPQDIHSGATPQFSGLQLLDQGALELRELALNGTDYVRLRSPAALTASYVLTFPTTAGTAGYLLTTDGAGLLSWSAPYSLPTGLSNFDANNATGILVQTAADTFASRQIVGTADQVIVVNGDGVSGNPTLSLPQSIATTSSPTFASLSLSSPLAVASGGTGSTSFTTNALLYYDSTKLVSAAALTNGQLLIGSTGAAPVAAALSGTFNQVVVTNGAGSITLSLPQDIASTSSPTFAALSLSSPLAVGSGGTGSTSFTTNALLYSDGTKLISSAALTNGQLLIGSTGNAPVAAAITGTANQVVVTNGSGSITLSLPQNIASSSTPTFSGLNLTSHLFMENQKEARFYELTANGSHYVAIRSPADLSVTTTYSLPIADGTSGQFLATDGTGALYWEDSIGLTTGLINFDANNTPGILVQTTADNYASRQIVGTANQVVVVDGDGVAGNPVLSLPQNIHSGATPQFSGLQLLNQGALELRELAANGSDYLRLRAPASLTAPYVLTFPADAGTAGYLLTTDGAGLLSWSAPYSLPTGLSNFDANNATGILVQTAADAFASRTIQGTANQVLVVDGDGVSSNPVLSLPQDIHSGATPQFASLQLLNQGALELRELAANGTDYLRLRAPASLTAPYVLTFPTTAGTAGYLLTTDGTGLLSWSAPYSLPTGLSNFDANNVTGILVQTAADTYASRTLIGTADQVIVVDGDGVSGNPTLSLPQSIATTSSPTFAALTLSSPLAISSGGTGSSSFTTNALLYYDGTKLISSAALTNGQLLIGSTGAAPVAATIAGTANQVVVTNGAGSITLSLPQDLAAGSTPTFNGLNLNDSLNIKNQKELRLGELTTNGSDYVGLRSAANLLSSYVLTLPDNVGTADYLLATDGTGVLSWVAPYSLPTGLGNFDANNAVGILVQTTADNYASRQIVGTADQVLVVNGDGVAGNPTLSLPQSIATTSTPTFNGLQLTENLLLENQKQLRLYELASNGSEYVGLRAPIGLLASYLLTFPIDAGIAGQVLTTDGAGVLTWESAAGLPVGLSNFDANNTPGILVQTTADNYASRQIVGTANQVVVVDGDGVAGNPVLSLPQDIHSGASPQFSGLQLLNQGVLELRELVANGADYVRLRAPAALSSPYTLTLPTTSGTADYLLTTDGSGLLSWSAPYVLPAGLTAFDANNATGILVQTAADVFASRTIQGTTNQVVVVNGDGVAGNPTLSLPQDIHSGASPQFSGLELLEQGELRLRELGANGVQYVGLRALASLSASYTLTFPTTAGTAGYLLTTDGAGLLSWSAPYTLPTGLSNFDANNATGIIVQTSADNYASRTLIGTADQVIVVDGDGVAGNPTLSLPQSIATTSSPTFNALTLSTPLGRSSGGTGNGTFITNGIIIANATQLISTAALTNGQLLIGSTGAAPVAAALAGTANQVVVSNGAGSITLSLPQDIHSGATPQFSGLLSTENFVVDNQKELRLRELTTNGSEYVGLRAPASLTVSYLLTLPTTAGTAGHLLTTDGAGELSWSAPYTLPTGLSNFDANNTAGILVQTAADTFASRTLTGTANQVIIANGDGVAGNPTFSLPQSIATTSSPTFAALTLTAALTRANGGTGNTTFTTNGIIIANATQLISTAAPTNGQLLIGSTGAAPVLAALTGTANQVVVSNGAGSITLSLPQNIHTAATPTFSTVTTTAGATLAGGVVNLGGAADNAAINIGSVSSGGRTITIGSLTGADGIAMNVGTGNFSLNSVAAATISIGGAARTGLLSLGTSSATNSIDIGNGTGATTINLANGITGNTVAIANGATTGTTAVRVLSGVGTAGTASLELGDNPRVTSISLGASIAAAARLLNVFTSNQSQNNTINILNGAHTAGTQTLNIMSGAITGGSQVINMGSTSGATTTNISAGTGGLNITAASTTVDGDGQVNGEWYSRNLHMWCARRITTTQTINSTTPQPVVFNVEDLGNANYNTTTGIYTVQKAGYYRIDTNVSVSSANTQNKELMIYINGAITIGNGFRSTQRINTGTIGMISVSFIRLFAVNDTIQVRYDPNNASNDQIQLDSHFSGQLIHIV